MLSKKTSFSPKKQIKKMTRKHVFEYKSIKEVPDKYLDFLLVQTTPDRLLRDFFSKENEATILKRIKLKHKISKNIASLEEKKLKDVSVDYIELDKSRSLYSFIMSANISIIEEYSNEKALDFIYGTKEEFLENLQKLINEISVSNVITYIRTEREDLHNLIPWLLAKWEDSQEFEMEQIKDTFGFDASSVDLDAFDIDVDFDMVDMDKEYIDNIDIAGMINSKLFTKDHIKDTIFIMKECLDVLGKKVEDNEKNDEKVKELEKLVNENKKLITKLERKNKSKEIKMNNLELENNDLKEKLKKSDKKLIELEEADKKNKLKIEELKKEKREINKKSKLQIEELEHSNEKLQLKLKDFEQIKLDHNQKIENITNISQKQTKELEQAKQKCVLLENKIYEIELENKNLCNKYEDKLQELTIKLNLENEKEALKIKNNELNNTEEFNDMFQDYGDLFGDALDNNPTYSK